MRASTATSVAGSTPSWSVSTPPTSRGELETTRFGGAEQQQALERLIRAAGARERLVMTKIRQLEELTGMAADLEAASAAAGAAEPAAAEEAIAEGEEKRGLHVVFESEDLVDNADS